jgi:DNA-binding response OmpR family regulator
MPAIGWQLPGEGSRWGILSEHFPGTQLARRMLKCGLFSLPQASVPLSSTKTAQPSVLLIEEYDALSVAIQSALTKFAPQHRFQAVSSLPEARQVALEHKPELIILDFDPPLPGAIAFFGEMKGVLPDTRVLALVAGVPPDLIAQRGANAALQFLTKPFELVEFGAAVQALLGPWMETGTPRGSLRDLALDDVAVLALSSPRNIFIEVHAGENRTGELHIRNNQIVHARAGDIDGTRAIAKMLAWSDPRFIENIDSEAAPRTIHDSWATALIDALREGKQLKSAHSAPPEPQLPTKAVAAVAKAGPKILIIDDTEMLLIFVEDSLALADATLQVTTAATGQAGVKEAARIIPDLVLADYVLPDIKGDEVCRRIGRNESTARVPIIMMSGHVHEMAAVASKLPNVVATIAKPFRSEALVALVEQTLKNGPLKEKPIFPTEKEIAEAKAADLGTSKLPVLPKPVPRPPSTMPKSSASLAVEAGAPATVTPPLQAKTDGEVVGAGSRELGPPQVPAQSQPRPRSAGPGPQKPDAIPPRLATNEVMLDLPLDVVAMQVNSAFQIGAIRARPASSTVAIEIPTNGKAVLPLKTGFQLGPIDLDAAGNISIVRLIPTSQPFRAAEMRSAFEIGGVTVVPANERERVQLMSTAVSMTMQLFAPLELISVELSPSLEITQLILRCRGKAVRVSLNARGSQTHTDAKFETTRVQLDQSRRIDELTLTPIGG